ncbi:hypothetical protein L1887_19653 [Cichorium endivia]|nr:hypothetical protein L1887_19653 [Cichorium endivia]
MPRKMTKILYVNSAIIFRYLLLSLPFWYREKAFPREYHTVGRIVLPQFFSSTIISLFAFLHRLIAF